MARSFGTPSIIMPQLPQIAIRHDQRKLSVPSSSSLMYCSPCSTDMSSVNGTSRSGRHGLSSCSGR